MCLILNGYRLRAVRISRLNSVRFLFVWMDEEWSLQNKVDTREKLLARILNAVAHIRKREYLLEQRSIFAHELQSVLRLSVKFSKIYCKL